MGLHFEFILGVAHGGAFWTEGTGRRRNSIGKKRFGELSDPTHQKMKFSANITGILERPIYNWRTELEQVDRKCVDDPIFKALGMSDKQKECMELLRSLMEKRESKAQRVHA